MMTFAAFPQSINALIVGASKGIGLEFTRQLLGNHQLATVHAVSRSASSAPGLAALAHEYGERLQRHDADVCDEASLAKLADQLKQASGQLDLMIYACGLLHDGDAVFPERKLGEVDPQQLMRSFQVNAFGPLLSAKHFSALLPRKSQSVIAHLSARVGSLADNRLGGWYSYRGSKAAQNTFTRNLAIELGRRHKKLVCVALHPGTVDTQLSQPFQKNVPPDKLFSPEKSVRQLLQVIDGLRPEDNGRFFAYDGSPIPW